MRRRARPEDNIQRAVFHHVRARGVPGLVAWHTPNGSARNPIEAAILKGLGVRAGVSDVVAVHDSKVFALELKSKTGRPTEAQVEFIADIEKAGTFTAICYGTDSAVKTLEVWGLLRGRVLP
jgi:VRR-NUC domain